MDLFSYNQQKNIDSQAPLAWRMRPQSLDEISGQKHIIGPEAPLRQSIKRGLLTSLILYGPSGSGKTTLARIIADQSNYHFVLLPAVSSGVGDIRKIAADAAERLKYYQQKTILFIDEIHRFNKNQQDVLLPYVEDGTLLLIGATTENPLYELNSALLSRVKLYILEPLSKADISEIIHRALQDKERGLGNLAITITEDGIEEIIQGSKGDARMTLNIIDILANSYYLEGETLQINAELVQRVTGIPLIKYDRQGDWHYDAISAFIKSVRGSDPQAALYWLAIMLTGGEKPEFIIRRLLILAAEDIGLADPQALVITNAAAQAVHFTGMPEAKIILAEATIYLAAAPKSNTAKTSINNALECVHKQTQVVVPPHIADASHSRASNLLNKGKNYKYPHDFGGYVKQSYLPPELQERVFYSPSNNGYEKKIAQFLEHLTEK
jgi:putative ATPase